jgi:undecaprenyl-diphosphatase
VNQRWINAYLDQFMPFITKFENTKWLALAAGILFFLILRKKGVKIVLGCALAVGIGDLCAAKIIKPAFQRQRPEFVMTGVRLLVPSQSSESFPSNHATNMFAAARFLSFTAPLVGAVAYGLAFAVAYSRVYVGVHFPGDVLGGMILGTLSGIIAFKILYAIGFVDRGWRWSLVNPPAWLRRRHQSRLRK